MSHSVPQIPDLDVRLGVIIRALRKEQGLNQKALAQMVGVTQASISQIENGRNNLRINLNTLQRLATALGVGRLSVLIQRAEDVPSLEVSLRNANDFLKYHGMH